MDQNNSKTPEAEQKPIEDESSYNNSDEGKGLIAQPESLPIDQGEGNRGPNDGLVSPPKSQITISDEDMMLDEKVEGQLSEIEARVDHLKLRLPRLNGAQKKRYKWLVNNGHSNEEARKLAVIPLSEQRQQKRPESDVLNHEQQPRKKRKIQIKGIERTEDEKSSQPAKSSKDALEEVRIGILDSDYPQTLLSANQISHIQEAILRALMEDEEIMCSPSFHGINRKQGYLVVICQDKDTADWLKGKESELKPWEGASLRVVPEEEIHSTRIVSANFPNSNEDPTKLILQLLQKQNMDLPAMSWNVLCRREEGTTALMTLVVDEKTSARLERGDLLVNFKFGRVQLRLVKRPQQPPSALADTQALETAVLVNAEMPGPSGPSS